MPVIPSPYAVYTHTTSGGNIIRRAMRLLGVLATGEEPSAAEMTDCLEALNQMLDQWNSQPLTIPALFRYDTTLAAGTQTYTIGAGGDIDIEAPIRLQEEDVFLQDGDLELPIHAYSQEEWAGIPLKGTSGRPQGFYYEKIQPFARINLWPIPDRGFGLVLYLEVLLTQIFSPQSKFSLPQAYAKAMVFNLAVDLAPEFQRSVTPEIAEGASSAMGDLKRVNMEIPLLRCESGSNSGDPQYISALFGIPYVGK
jgi:hypothetical protein